MARCFAVLSMLVAVGLLFGGTSAALAQSKLAFVRDGNIWVANTDGSEARQLTTSGKDRHPALSPDGQWVAFTREQTGGPRLGEMFLVPTKGGDLKPLRPQGMDGAASPGFSPDGKSLVFVGASGFREDRSGNSFATMSVNILNLQTGEVKELASNPDTNLNTGYIYDNPVFSPVGGHVAYQEAGSDVSGGFVVLTRTGHRVFRFPGDPRDYNPYWRPGFSADGRKILCYSPAIREGEPDVVYLVGVANRRKTKVTEGANPTFVDGGKGIVFERMSIVPSAREGEVKRDLWRLDLTPGAQPGKILENAIEPSGQ